MTHVDGSDHLVIERTENDHGVCLAVAGELTVATRDQLANAIITLIEERHTAIELNLHDVAFIDSQGLWALMRAQEHSVDGTTLRITDASKSVRRLLQLTTLDKVFGLPEDA